MSNCKGCGKEIIWAETSDGKKIPLDPKPPTYIVYQKDTLKNSLQFCHRSTALVSHFATCPAANRFSSKNKAPTLKQLDPGF